MLYNFVYGGTLSYGAYVFTLFHNQEVVVLSREISNYADAAAGQVRTGLADGQSSHVVPTAGFQLVQTDHRPSNDNIVL